MSSHDALDRLTHVRQLAETGRHAAVVACLAAVAPQQVRGSPTLALMFGTAHARLGRHAEGRRWVELALAAARERGDRAVEVRALNVCGAIALEGGKLGEAESFFTRGLAQGAQEEDHAAMGRCATNLGIIASMRGDFDRAVGAYVMALAAFQRAALPWGVVVTYHDLAKTYRDQGDLPRALGAAQRAVDGAAEVGDLSLQAQTMAGRAEIRILSGDAAVGRREIARSLATHRRLGDVVREAEDLRILAAAETALGELSSAEARLRDVIERAGHHTRPLLGATAQRDLASVLHRLGRDQEAYELARAARAKFDDLGCVVEARKLDLFLNPQ